MGKYFDTKHDVFNLKFKEHEVFTDKLVVVDESNTPYLWLDKESGKVSFSGKYFHLYKEQRLVEALKSLVYAVHEFVERNDEIVDDKEMFEHFVGRFERVLTFVDEVEREVKVVDDNASAQEMNFYEVYDPYYALILARNEDEAYKLYTDTVADDEGNLSEEIKLVDHRYGIVKFSRCKSEDGELLKISEILKGLKSDKPKLLVIDGSLL